MGMAFDDEGCLYVVELRADCVRKVRLSRTPRVVPAQAAPRTRTGSGQQARACTICHLEWLPPFSEGRDSGLMARPAGSADDPVVARGETCLSCHNGSVADSRQRVWEKHGHRTGITPPESM